VVASFVKVFSHVLILERVAMGSMTPIAFDEHTLRARLQEPDIRAYYRRGGIDVGALLESYIDHDPRVYGPDFDRTRLVDLNRDLFPRDEFGIKYQGP
jgi:hypothetical protein